MQDPDLIKNILKACLQSSPVILACLAGCAAVIMKWRSLRGGALPAIAGFGFMSLLAVVFPIIWVVVPNAMRGKTGSEIQTMFTILGVVHGLCYALALVLLMLGVTMGRAPVEPPVK